MSHAVEINYEQIAIQCQSVCEVAETQADELECLLAELKDASVGLASARSETLYNEILLQKENLIKHITELRQQADAYAERGIVRGDTDRLSNDPAMNLKQTADALLEQVNQFASGRMAEFRALIESNLADSIAGHEALMHRGTGGAITVDSRTQQLLDSIEDAVLRQFTYLAYLQDPALSGDALIQAGKRLMTTTVEERQEQEAAQIRRELEAARVSASVIERITQPGAALTEMRENAAAEIVGEKVRQKSLKIIMKAITERGFIVDKKNIRVNRETNEVTMIAQKASSEKAEFKVFLDGRFIYDFRGYTGQACQKDIQPFVNALEEVYGMHIKETKEIWSNPDKLSTMKYQAMNTNKNRR